MMRKSVVSVVVPIYNVEKYLERCLESIVNQTYKNLEIILVDDGSLDRCPQICDEWARIDKRIKVIHKKNGGVGMARNTGIENATGDYIVFVDSDDYLDLSVIEKANTIAIKECVDLVCYGYKNVTASGRIEEKNHSEIGKLIYRGNEVKEQILPELLSNDYSKRKVSKLMLSACNALFSLDLIKRTSWKFVSEREIISEDVYSLLELFSAVESVAIIPNELYFYVYNELSLTRTYRKDRYNRIKFFYDKSLKLCKDNNYSEIVQRRMGSVYLGFVIGTLKLIVMSKITLKEKIGNINCIVIDPHLEQVLLSVDDKIESSTRRLIKQVMIKKRTLLCYMIIYAKITFEKLLKR